MAMAAVYAHRYRAPVTASIAALRDELFPEGFANVDFRAGRSRVREADLFARPTALCRAAQGAARLFDRLHVKRLRRHCREELIRRIRWELRNSSHTSISPVSGFFNILALWLDDPHDADCRAALRRLDDWIWEDEGWGARVTGARSASWDTGFALQALAAAPAFAGQPEALRKGADFLRRQQIRTSFDGFREAERDRPQGRVVLRRRVAWLAGDGLHRGGGPRHDRGATARAWTRARSATRSGSCCAGRTATAASGATRRDAPRSASSGSIRPRCSANR